MGITMFTFGALLAPLQGLRSWFAPPAPRARSIAARSRPAPVHCRAPGRPLRVVRVVDGCSAAPGAGRMVISGRMAEVCAELDRLAALEAAAS